MTTVPLGEAKARLSALVDSAEQTHDRITITKHGKPAAVLISADDLEELTETIHWLSQPGIRETIDAGDREYESGQTTSLADLRAELGIAE
ncbi:type II toxin-antitoxin system Phd/YefM family antitoxin [Gordonia neofelifaecis]|uniref:Antitoxin n=1 Tax=Gordonia neofelifaecis NRRL B-59395 TaxID=644548 RepID=F1YHW8_9ACTN|nr:type II toxin-antitoxin system Phd/YefM family antitoxin [Gordonia neofelifaecis]EGD55522.1 prevent-host-death family protein [Gordonia neofelifaecis NRRL B-59395]